MMLAFFIVSDNNYGNKLYVQYTNWRATSEYSEELRFSGYYSPPHMTRTT